MTATEEKVRETHYRQRGMCGNNYGQGIKLEYKYNKL